MASYEPQQPDNPRARARADKAYRNALRPWYKKKRFVLPIALVMLFVVIGALSGENSTQESVAQPANPGVSAPGAIPPAQAPAAPAAPAEDPTVLSDDGWGVDTFNITDNGIGGFSADARIVNNTGAAKQGAVFTMTVLEAGAIVATLTGSAQGVGAGETATVSFFSQDNYREGAFTYAFQVDTAY